MRPRDLWLEGYAVGRHRYHHVWPICTAYPGYAYGFDVRWASDEARDIWEREAKSAVFRVRQGEARRRTALERARRGLLEALRVRQWELDLADLRRAVNMECW